MKFRADKLCEDITASDGYFKRLCPLLALLLPALGPVAYVYAHTDDMPDPDAILVEVAATRRVGIALFSVLFFLLYRKIK